MRNVTSLVQINFRNAQKLAIFSRQITKRSFGLKSFNDFSFHHFSQVMPTLEAFMLSKNPDFRLQNFHLPHFVYGDVTSKGEGVLVLEDVSIKGKNLLIRELLKGLFACFITSVGAQKLFIVVVTTHK